MNQNGEFQNRSTVTWMTDFYQKCKDDWSKRLVFSIKGAGKI